VGRSEKTFSEEVGRVGRQNEGRDEGDTKVGGGGGEGGREGGREGREW